MDTTFKELHAGDILYALSLHNTLETFEIKDIKNLSNEYVYITYIKVDEQKQSEIEIFCNGDCTSMKIENCDCNFYATNISDIKLESQKRLKIIVEEHDEKIKPLVQILDM